MTGANLVTSRSRDDRPPSPERKCWRQAEGYTRFRNTMQKRRGASAFCEHAARVRVPVVQRVAHGAHSGARRDHLREHR